jgi:hypothetical protein
MNVIDWVLKQDVDPKDASNVIDARNRFNQAASTATLPENPLTGSTVSQNPPNQATNNEKYSLAA